MQDKQQADEIHADQASFWPRMLLWSALCIVLTPVLVLTLCLLFNGFSVGETISQLIAQMQADRRNLLLVGLPAVVPFALLALVLVIYRRWRGCEGSNTVATAGAGGIVVMLIWANASFWPLFLPGRSYPGWPHGLEMVIVPLFFAPISMLVAVFIALLWVRKKRE